MFSNLKNKLNIFFYIFLVIILLCGILIRALYWAKGMNFWGDELNLALPFFQCSFVDFFTHVNAHYKCPPLFCASVFILLKLFGYKIHIFTLVSFISSIISLILFTFVSLKLFKSKIPVLLGVFIFSVSVPLIYYSQEFKPYSTDVMVCLFLIFIYDYIHFKDISIKNMVLCSITAFLLPILSFPAVFITPAFICAKLIEEKCISKKVIPVIFGYVLSCTYMGLLYINIHSYEKSEFEWQSGFLTFSAKSVHDVLSNFFMYSIYNYNDKYFYIIIAFLIAGLVLLLKYNRKYGILFTLIIAAYTLASFLHIYPLVGRMILSLIPILILLTVKISDNKQFQDDKLNAALPDYIKSLICVVFIFIILNLKCIPYVNIPEEKINLRVSEKSRNVMAYAMKDVLKNIQSNGQVLTTEEIRDWALFYNYYLKYKKNLSFTMYFDIADTPEKADKTLNDYLDLLIKDNKPGCKLIIVRHYEDWETFEGKKILVFLESKIDEVLKSRKIKYTKNKKEFVYWYFLNI